MATTSLLLYAVVLPADRDAFNALHGELNEAIQPQGVFEQFAFERLVTAAWNMRRVSAAEISLLARSNGEDPLTHPDTAKDAQRFLTLARQLESSYKRTHKELVDLQTIRAIRNLDDEMPPLALPNKIASFVKQTQTNTMRDLDIHLKNLEAQTKQWIKENRNKPVAKQSQTAKPKSNERVAEQSQPRPAAKPQPIVHPDKVGRNEPCPCGSGQKYKRCCGNPINSLLAHTA